MKGQKTRNDSGGVASNRCKVSAGALTLLTTMVTCMITVAVHGTVAYAVQGEGQVSEVSGRVNSSGTLRYKYAVIDGNDLRAIDAYISEKKNTAAGILIRLGTKFRRQSGEYVYDRNPDAIQEDIDLSGLSWTMLSQAVQESQNVPAGLPVLNPEMALHIEGVEECTDSYVAAVEDNLSAGKAAWVDGRLLLGNGADNNRAYQQGITDGGQGIIPENLCPIYGAQEVCVEIRHAHIGSQAESEGISGCYHNYSETVSQKKKCDLVLRYLEPEWRPNENEPEGGSWHGGFYTCPHHSGAYSSPGICGKEYVKYVTTWNHDVICGRENMLYARLTIKVSGAEAEQAPDADWVNGTVYSEGQICLNAVLEQGEGYDQLIWQEGDKLVWTDDRGNVMSTDSTLTVFEPGIYRCSINVVNSDIDHQMAEVVVTVSGLMISGN